MTKTKKSFLVGVVLAQLGEFSFVMATIANEGAIINEFGEHLIIGLTVLSLAFSPLWLASAKRLKDLADVNSIPLQSVLSVLYGEKFSIFKKLWSFLFSFFKRSAKHKKLLSKPEDSQERLRAAKDDHFDTKL